MNQNNISTLFGKYRCEDKEKLLAELNINKTNDEELKYTLNKNQELVSSLFFKNTSEWKQDSGLMDAYKKAWPYSDMDYLKQQRDDYCFWENTSLSSKSNVTFFHPVKFIGLMDKIKIINLHAEELLRVQNRILKMNTLKENGPGIFDKGGYTFCNHAAFLTIRAVDSDYLKFTDNYDAPIDSKYSKYDKTYPYKESSYWCVVLKKQADSKIISELTTCKDIIYYANLGYVVIVAWENPSSGAPHYATVRPGNDCKEIKDIKLCNVSTEVLSGEQTMSIAFGDRIIKNCHFYVNKNQAFREDYDFSGSRSASITSLESKHGVE